MEKEEIYLSIKKPIVSHLVGEYIENTRGEEAMDIKIEVELSETKEGFVGIDNEVAQYISNCFEEFIIAREYGYIVG